MKLSQHEQFRSNINKAYTRPYEAIEALVGVLFLAFLITNHTSGYHYVSMFFTRLLIIVACISVVCLLWLNILAKSSVRKYRPTRRNKHQIDKCNLVTKRCNKRLKATNIGTCRITYGSMHVHDCSSLNVLRGCEEKPIQYIRKYFNITATTDVCDNVERVLSHISNNHTSSERFYVAISELARTIRIEVPLACILSDATICRLAGVRIPKTRAGVRYWNYPVIEFSYTSPRGRSHDSITYPLSLDMLNELASSLGHNVSKHAHAKQQRSMMTAKLRTSVKERDNYTCRICGLSTEDEPNLLLEVDHIQPVSKGGRTEMSNLQTLCWRCNRSKSTS